MKLRHGLPVALLAFGTLLCLSFYGVDRLRSVEEVEQQAIARAAFNGDRLAAEVEDEIIAGDAVAAERTLVRLSAMPHLRQAMVFDDHLKVLFASRFNRKGADFAALRGLPPAERFAAAGMRMAGDVLLSDERGTLWSIYPLRLPPEPGELRTARVGYMYLEYDLSVAKDLARWEAGRRFVVIGAGIALLCLVLWAGLDRLVARRLKALADAARAFGSGQGKAKGSVAALLPPAGNDEIGSLSATLGAMMEEISRHQGALSASNEALSREIEERRQAEEKLRLAGQVIASSNDAIMITDATHHIMRVNPAFTRVNGYEPEEVLGKLPAMLRSNRHDSEFYDRMWEEADTRGNWQGEVWHTRKGGEQIALWHSVTPLRDANGRITHFVIVSSDLSRYKEAEERIRFLANFDLLTGLPNRVMLQERLHRAIEEAAFDREELALVLLNVDRFQAVNDSLGSGAGDELLQAIAARLGTAVQDGEMAARMGGDEFAVLLPRCGVDRAAWRTQQLLGDLCRRYDLSAQPVEVTVSAGVSLFPHDARDGSGLLRDADAAARHAKEAERGGFRFFAPEMNAQALDRFALENDLRHALAEGQLFLAYQPQVEVAGGRVVGVEALVRWQHPEKGLISPARFIPVAEESGLILSLGDWVLREATRQAAAWQAQGMALRIAVNLSALQFRQSQLPTQVHSALEEAGLEPRWLELEITESTLMDNTEQAISHLWELSDMGVQLAIDDFGTGYSSLAYLKRFPLQRLKIDQAFVRDLSSDANDAAIVTAIVGLARSLGMQVTAEGVETAEQLAYLVDLACDEYQGYYCSRPVPAAEIAEVVARQATLLET